MTKHELVANIFDKESYLCVGLDPDSRRLPQSQHTRQQLIDFLRTIIDVTLPHCIAYKPNVAYYESMGHEGEQLLKQVLAHIPSTHFIIADAKRGDIENSSLHYADSYFSEINYTNVDAVTVNPYMGKDSVVPFIRENKWVIVLALTSNLGAEDFQLQRLNNGRYLYEEIICRAAAWGSAEQVMFVVGATRGGQLAGIRKLIPDYFLLLPGVGVQGGSLREASVAGFNSSCGLIVNAGRSIMYASSGKDFAEAAKNAARRLHDEMSRLIETDLPYS